MTSKTSNKFPAEERQRAVRMVMDHEGDHSSRWTACQSISAKIGCSAHTLLDWVKKAEVDAGRRAGAPTDVAERMKALERENRELRQANEILRKASACFAQAELDRPFRRRSRSLTITVRRMGSSRSAGCCRSPRQPATLTSPVAQIPGGCPRGRSGIWRSSRKSSVSSYRACLRRELRSVRRAQGLASDVARRLHGCTLHCRAADGRPQPARRRSRQTHRRHGAGQGGAMSTRPCEPGLSCPGPEPAMAFGLHLRQHLVRLRLRGFRH